MTDEKDLLPNREAENDAPSILIPDNIILFSATIEDVLAKYLKDFSIEKDFVMGYINDLDTFREILEKLKEMGFTFSVRDSDERQKQRERIKRDSGSVKGKNGNRGNKLLNHLTVFYQLRAMPIKFFGLPFTIDRTTHYQCAYGCKYYKSRATSSKAKAGNSDGQTVKKKKSGSKKIGCLAKLTIKQITVYPEYRLHSESDWRKKKKLIESLRKNLSDTNTLVEQQQRFYLSMSIQASHNHPPIITKPKPKDSTSTQQISKYHKILVKPIQPIQPKRTEVKDENMESSEIVSDEFYGNYVQLATTSLDVCETESETEQNITTRTLTVRDDNFFNTLLRFPNTTSNILEQVEFKQSEIQIEIKPIETTENPPIEVYEYQPTLQDLQTIFKEKLKNLYTLCSNCNNGPLLLRLAGELEQVEIQLATEENFGSL